MSRPRTQRMHRSWIWLALLALVWLLCSGEAWAGALRDRLDTFPEWTQKAPTQAASGDLIYPDWMAGTWHLTSTLVDLVAPFAPDLETPGFEGNRSLLHQPVTCDVRFEPKLTSLTKTFWLQPRLAQEQVVADRAFNGLNLARAYLGETAVKRVTVDPENPNRQLMVLQGDRQLESTILRRATEQPSATEFITTEVSQQIFRGLAQPYINEVETTTAYQLVEQDTTTIEAEQVTAIYLSAQDPNYFKAPNQPVALYRYHLTLSPVAEPCLATTTPLCESE